MSMRMNIATQYNRYTFFLKGPLSQWYASPFVIDGIAFVNCEQWMMFNKAVLFKDWEIAEQILEVSSPATHKQLGRQVRNFDDDKWMEVAYAVVLEGNYAKFRQNPTLKQKLFDTAGTLLVEANPRDGRWGIGLSAEDPACNDPSKWKGQNLLGQVLTEVRENLLMVAPVL